MRKDNLKGKVYSLLKEGMLKCAKYNVMFWANI